LHVHLEGSLAPPTLLALATKHRLDGMPTSPDALADWYAFRDFPHFIEIFGEAVRALRDEEDFALLALETGRTLAAQNVRYAEISFTPYLHLARGVPADVIFTGIERGRLQAERDHAILIRWIADFPGHHGVPAAEITLDAVERAEVDSVIAFNVGGIEVERNQFRGVFARARAAGLRSVPHAGETGGPDAVWSAIRSLRADRIGHGIGAMADPELVTYLRDTQLPLDVCVTSNLRTRVVATLQEHPLPRMMEAGLLVTLNSDDPPMFGTDLLAEYRAAHRLGLDADGLAQLARNSINASFLNTASKAAVVTEIDQTLRTWKANR
jgi:aminodeoxyfutalosine deaminase